MDEAMTMQRTFNVRYTPDDNGQWLVEVLSSPDSEPIGVYTHGRTLAKAEANAREALAIWFEADGEESVSLLPTINLDANLIRRPPRRRNVGKLSARRRRVRRSSPPRR